MIGNLADAMQAAEFGKAGRGRGHVLPASWAVVGGGSSRWCYGKDGVVYKYESKTFCIDECVCSSVDKPYCYSSNQIEFRYAWWLKGQEMPEGYLVPETWYYPECNIVAMEYINGSGDTYSVSTAGWAWLGQNDVGGANCVRTPQGIYYIDLGYCEEEIRNLLPPISDIL